MKFLRVIRFDGSDDHVFENAARPDEWALPGGFEFAGIRDEQVVGKTRQAFANGFLGIPSFGRSTFATISEMSGDDHDELLGVLSNRFVEVYGAPSRDDALAAARSEADFVIDLCAGEPVNTVFTLRRILEDGEIREEFRIITPPSEPIHTKVWQVVEDDA